MPAAYILYLMIHTGKLMLPLSTWEISESLEAPTGVGRLLRSSLSSIADPPLVLWEPMGLLSAKFIKTYKNKKNIYF